mmetsp:Transcript_13491/g.35657  ORF Transcript_13491/g.35657 Transcript_13491/m.35657 type:complete len:497 (-) Transcript_13491:494-1984(-)
MGCRGSKDAGAANSSSASKGSAPKGAKEMPKKGVKEGGMGHAQFIRSNEGKIVDLYDMEKKKLGEGSYGSVCKAKSKGTGTIRAVKTISKAQMKNIDRFKQEIAIMKMMDHPNIIKLFESFEDHRNIYLVMELCAGGELFDRIIESGHFTEVQAATIMQQIVRAINYMHENRICHRDLKPENFLFTTKDPIEKNTLKIIDFGLSCKYEPNQVLTTKAGTPYYVAPQVLAGKYDQMSDLWSCGVIMYLMLCGRAPFNGNTEAVARRARTGSVSFAAEGWRSVSKDAKDLLRGFLKMNTEDRLTAQQALRHPWFETQVPAPTHPQLWPGFLDHLRGFCSQSLLQRAARQIIATQLDDGQISGLRKAFMAMDSNGNGTLTYDEFRDGLVKAGVQAVADEDLLGIVSVIDFNHSGVIEYSEFLAAALDRRLYLQEDVCLKAFDVFDVDGDGKISMSEIEEVLGCKACFEEYLRDVDDDGLDFEEFMSIMRRGSLEVSSGP